MNSNSYSLIDSSITQAIALHESGKIEQAKAVYQQLLRTKPRDPKILYLLGTAEYQLGNIDESLNLLDRSLGILPDNPIAYNNRGLVFLKKKEFQEALANFDKALKLKPDYVDVYNNRGITLQSLGRLDEAIASYKKATELKPDFADTYVNIGKALFNLERHSEAIACYDKALELDPASCDAFNNRGGALHKLGRFNEAVESYDQALKIRPDYATAHNNRGIALQNLHRFEDALKCFTSALAINPDNTNALSFRGMLLSDLRRFEEALADYEHAISLDRNCAVAQFARAELLLLHGDYLQGWDLYEWRWKTSFKKTNHLIRRYPFWSGEENISGKRILIHPEFGFGDYIMFVRYVGRLQQLGASIVLYAPKPLVSLFSTLKGDISVIEEGAALPEIDLQCPIMSLPHSFKTTLENIPQEFPYLTTPVSKQEYWKGQISASGKKRIGLVWSGKSNRNIDSNPLKNRSIPLSMISSLISSAFEFHSLQKETSKEDSEALLKLAAIKTHVIEDFADTAALIDQMDLIITIDTAVTHLAGALGKRLWVMLPYSTDYRWMKEGSCTPWYPKAALFRQVVAGNWEGVICAVKEELDKIPDASI